MPTSATHSPPSRMTSTRVAPKRARGATAAGPKPIRATPPGTGESRGIAADAASAVGTKSEAGRDSRNRRRFIGWANYRRIGCRDEIDPPFGVDVHGAAGAGGSAGRRYDFQGLRGLPRDGGDPGGSVRDGCGAGR